MYLHVRHSGTFFLRSSYHYFFKNIAHVRSICNFDQSCILGGFSPQKLLDVSRHPVPFSWAGKLFVFTARKPLHPQHFVFATKTLLFPCPSLGIQPYPQRFIFSKDSVYGGQISPVYCGFSPSYIAVKTIPVLGGRSLRVQGIHTVLLPIPQCLAVSFSDF